MDKSQRIFYNTGGASLNGILIRGLKSVGLASWFNLEQCFCGCSVTMNAHYADCPNAVGKIIRTL